MTPTQREAALRLADALPGGQLYMRPWAEEAAALLRKLASEPTQRPLTDEQKNSICKKAREDAEEGWPYGPNFVDLVMQGIERAHGIIDVEKAHGIGETP